MAKPSSVHHGNLYAVKLHCSYIFSKIIKRLFHYTGIHLVRKREMENYMHNQKFSHQTFKSLTNNSTPKIDIQEIGTLEIKLNQTQVTAMSENRLLKLLQDIFRRLSLPNRVLEAHFGAFNQLLWATLVGSIKNQDAAMCI